MVKFVKIFLLSVFLNACKDQQLILENQNFQHEKSPIRIDGFYSLTGLVDFGRGKGYEKTYDIHFLYENRIIFGGATYPADSIDKFTKEAIVAFSKTEKDYKSQWGIYRIDDLRIEFEKWEPSSGGPMKTVIRRGCILNDTTFVITEKLNNYDGKTYHVRDTFRFREFFPKPDSTNRFIK